MSSNLAPIVLFVYARPEHTKVTVEALQKNKLANQTPLIIFSDAAKNNKQIKNVKMVRDYIKTISGFANIHIVEREKNMGLANSVIQGVTQVINEYGKAIIVEDDIVTSPYFLRYMNLTLDKYEHDKRIYSVSGFNFPPSVLKIPKSYAYSVFFALRPLIWGWATWKDRWEQVDWKVRSYEVFSSSLYLQKMFNMGGKDLTPMLRKQMNGNIDSWAIIFCFNQMRLHGLSVHPVHSYVDNIGFDGSGTHGGLFDIYKNDVALTEYEIVYPTDVALDLNILESFYQSCGQNYCVEFGKIVVRINSLSVAINNFIRDKLRRI